MFLRGVLFGWVSLLMGIAAVGLFAKAFSFDLFDCSRHALVLNTISKHINPGRKYNEKNLGIAYECRRQDPAWGWQAGYYKNSFNRDTWYGVIAYQPLALWGVRLGGFAGAGTGYREEEKDNGPDEPRGGLSPIVGLIMSVEGKKRGLNIIVGTSVVFAQLKVLW